MDSDESYDEDNYSDEDIENSPRLCSQNYDDHDYECISSDELFKDMNSIIADVMVIITGVKPTQLRILLSKYKWDKELLLEKYYMGDTEREQIFKDAHIVYNKDSVVNRDEGESECQICFMSYLNKMMVGLDCQHRYCKECWADYLRTKIVDEGQSQTISCPTFQCDIIVDDELVMNLIQDSKVKAKYQHLITDCFVRCNLTLRWCPMPDCHHVVKARSPGEKPVRCKCGHTFCFKCGEDWHAPITCAFLKKWVKKCADDSETSHWINAHTKECPRCKVVIEKNGGCNHMVCRSPTCKYEFCWTCLGPWDPHGPSWYTCNRFSANDSKMARVAQERSREMLQRYLFYFDRYSNHLQSLKFEHKLCTRITEKMEELQVLLQLTWNEVQFLKDAVDVLCQCRQTLMYTYVFAFYLRSNNQSTIFENNQADLERATEKLSEFLERDINDHAKVVKQSVQDKTAYCQSRRKLLVEHVYEGYEEDWWNYFD